jgi:hypothetical protein
VPTVVVTADPEVTGWAQGLRLVAPGGVDLTCTDRPAAGQRAVPASARPGTARPGTVRPITARLLVGRARRVAGRLRRRLQGRPVATPPRHARLGADDLRGATLLITDCQSMPLAQQILQAHPGLHPVIELDRGGRLGPPPDAPEEVPE